MCNCFKVNNSTYIVLNFPSIPIIDINLRKILLHKNIYLTLKVPTPQKWSNTQKQEQQATANELFVCV